MYERLDLLTHPAIIVPKADFIMTISEYLPQNAGNMLGLAAIVVSLLSCPSTNLACPPPRQTFSP